jgi:formate dehydrogenase iron-sulfur subunit
MGVHPRALDYAESFPNHVIPDESELTCGTKIEPGKSYGFFTDTTLCIGCKACEVACKEWNGLPADHVGLTGNSYDNTGDLGANTWRHVAFVEKIGSGADRAREMKSFQSNWLMMSDVCKHCANAPCLEACPTGSIFRTCPTDSIQFGEVGELFDRARKRVEDLHDKGATDAYLYGAPDTPGATGGLKHLNAFFLLTDRPEVYNLPVAPTRASDRVRPSFLTGLAAMAGLTLAAAALMSAGRERGR